MTTESPPPPRSDRPELNDTPPILGSWRNIHAVVIGTLVVLVLTFSILTKVYQ